MKSFTNGNPRGFPHFSTGIVSFETSMHKALEIYLANHNWEQLKHNLELIDIPEELLYEEIAYGKKKEITNE